ncbi:uncharacterized protein LOC131009424 [Salvia miltiorrhiza]|uniref:uncharacterized protein LOC131009424 n=1 Tax=Salvia miltiorrhiza TaxID=226208 RepID=UPI0025ABF5C7|nr:uncharacterized protein LOC131009424 [Salvia miltiorrhiza]
MSDAKFTFIFNFWGFWKKDEETGRLKYDGWNSMEIEDTLGNMSLDIMMSEFESLIMNKPRAVYALDEDHILEECLILLRDQRHCAKVLDYLELLGQNEFMLFADHESDPMPSFTPLPLFPEEDTDTEIGNDGNDGVGADRVEVEKEIVEAGNGDGDDDDVGAEGIEVENKILEAGNGDGDNDDIGAEGFEGLDSIEQKLEAESSEGEGNGDEVRAEGEAESDDDSSVYSDDLGESDDDDEVKQGQFMGSVQEGEEGKFELGMTFAGAKETREAINAYGVMFGYKLKFVKNEPNRIRVVCMNEKQCIGIPNSHPKTCKVMSKTI